MTSSELPPRSDFLVIGGGVVGLTLALELRRRHPSASIVVLEKEREVGVHASGRNSGVVHAGFYYSADSLKARLTRRGNQLLTAWCDERGLAIRKCGKLVVARSEDELSGLDELARRGELNGVPLERISASQARELEPHARTFERALYSPTTSSLDPAEVMRSLASACRDTSIQLVRGAAWTGYEGGQTRTTGGSLEAGYVVNAAGLYADRIARAHGFGEGMCMLPFKGLYLYGNESAPPLGMHVYPVPDLQMPFLGVHLTVTVDGRVKIGPTAMPALWREGYHFDGAWLPRFAPRELWEVLTASGRLLLGDGWFRRHALRELPKMRAAELVRDASALVPGIDTRQFDRWGRPGIRAQLFDRRRGELVMDFRFEGDDRSMHVLNAVSPAFTCSFAFAELVADRIDAEAS